MRRVGVEQPIHNARAAGVGEQLALIADQAAGRRVEHETLAAAARRLHLHELGLALGQFLHHDAGMLLVEVDDDFLDRLEQSAVGRAPEQHLGARHAELEALAAHGLDQDAELELAAAGHFHGIAFFRFGDTQGDVAFGLAQQPVADHAAGDLGAFGAGQRRIVDPESHRQSGRVDRLGGKRRLNLGRANGVGDGGVGETGDGDDVAGACLVERRPAQDRGRRAPSTRGPAPPACRYGRAP